MNLVKKKIFGDNDDNRLWSNDLGHVCNQNTNRNCLFSRVSTSSTTARILASISPGELSFGGESPTGRSVIHNDGIAPVVYHDKNGTRGARGGYLGILTRYHTEVRVFVRC